MRNRQILVPIDFSIQSKAAIECACAFAKDSDAALLIVHAVDVEIQQFDGLGPVDPLEGLDTGLHAVRPADQSVAYAHMMLEGEPVGAILKVAETENVEMIVMGTHGRSGLTRQLMGSVAEGVVRQASCPVLTLRQPGESAKPNYETT